MRIAFVVLKHLLRGGGIEKYTLELGQRLVQRGHQVQVFSMGHYGAVERSVAGMEVRRVPSLRGPATEKLSAAMTAAAAALVSTFRPDIVHCHSIAVGALGPLFRLRGARTVLQMHGLEWKRSRWRSPGKAVLRRLEWLSMRGHHAYTAVSRLQCDHFREAYGLDFEYIPTGTDVPVRRIPARILEMGLQPDRYVLFASRLVREKGAHHLIDGFRRLETECKLVIAGDAPGERAYVEELHRAAGDDPRILFPGYVEGELHQELFTNAAVYVQPSEIEGLSIALLEAMGRERCCLVSDIPENLEAIGDTGVAFEQGNVEDLARRLGALLADPAARRELGTRALRRARELYSWDRVADAFEDLYRRVLAP